MPGKRRDPTWTVLGGGLMIISAMVAATVVTEVPSPGGPRLVVYVAALVVALTGAVFTLRDLT